MTDTQRFNLVQKARKKNLAQRLVIFLARFVGLTCIPRDYSLSLMKSATHAETLALHYVNNSPYVEGKWAGRADAYREISTEIFKL